MGIEEEGDKESKVPAAKGKTEDGTDLVEIDGHSQSDEMLSPHATSSPIQSSQRRSDSQRFVELTTVTQDRR